MARPCPAQRATLVWWCALASLVLASACDESSSPSSMAQDDAGSVSPAAGVSTGLSSPIDAARSGGVWYVADAAQDAAFVLNDAGEEIRPIGSRGSGPGQLRTPTAIAARDNRVLLADLGNRRISEYDTTGAFVRTVPSSGCQGRVVALRILAEGAILLRRCLQSDRRELLQIEVEAEGEFRPTEIRYAIASDPSGLAVVNFPIFDANDSRVVIGDGQSGCLAEYELSSQARVSDLCLVALPSVPVPDSVRARMLQRAGDRLAVPTVLPRLIALSLQDTGVAMVVPVDHVTSRWVLMNSLSHGQTASGRVLTDPFARRSFASAGRLLVFRDGEQGLVAHSIKLVP